MLALGAAWDACLHGAHPAGARMFAWRVCLLFTAGCLFGHGPWNHPCLHGLGTHYDGRTRWNNPHCRGGNPQAFTAFVRRPSSSLCRCRCLGIHPAHMTGMHAVHMPASMVGWQLIPKPHDAQASAGVPRSLRRGASSAACEPASPRRGAYSPACEPHSPRRGASGPARLRHISRRGA